VDSIGVLRILLVNSWWTPDGLQWSASGLVAQCKVLSFFML
jgi:hypothetical protein